MLGGLHREARRAYAAAGMLFKLHLDLLYQCDLDCQHCYLDDKSRRILPTAFWIDVLDQAAALGVFSLTLSGGEIFLRKDLFELIAHARARGLFVQLKSHGGHIDAAAAHRLAALGVSAVALSYYATRPEIHDAITRVPGSHARTRAAFEHLVAAGVTAIASCIVMRDNRDEWRAVLDECAARGVLVTLDGHLTHALSGDAFPRAHALDPEDAIALERHRLGHLETDCEAPGPPGAVGATGADDGWGDRKSCGAGHTSLYVSPEGDVTPCVMWPEPLGNLARGERLDALWVAPAGRLAELRGLRQRDRETCLRCEVREHCDYCAGQSFAATGQPTAPLRALCETTRVKTLARAAALGLPEPPLPAGLITSARPRFVVRPAPRG